MSFSEKLRQNAYGGFFFFRQINRDDAQLGHWKLP
jgi:hypothetical protein